MPGRSARFMVVIGFLVAATGTAIALVEILHDFRGTSDQEVLFQLAMAVSYGLIGWAWWSILTSLPGQPEAIRGGLRRPLRVVAVASAAVAVASVGSIDEVESSRLHWALRTLDPRVLTFGWVIVTVGLGGAPLDSGGLPAPTISSPRLRAALGATS